MKLLFKKNENGDVSVTMFKGTAEVPFSYIEMIKTLIAGEPIDAEFDELITNEEKLQINAVLNEVENTVKEKETAEDEPETESVSVDLPF